MARILKFNNYSRVFESNFNKEELETLRKKMNKSGSEKDLIKAMLDKLQDEAFSHQEIEQLHEEDAIRYLKQMLK